MPDIKSSKISTEIRSTVSYRIYDRYDYGICYGHYYGEQGYSSYRDNNRRYELQDALAHLAELKAAMPGLAAVVVEVTTIYKPLEGVKK